MGSTSQSAKNTITLKGSTEIVTEFFGYSINSILYQRGIYPPEDFTSVSKYNLRMMVSKDEGLKKYLSNVLTQVSEWLASGSVQQLVIVIASVDTKQVLERWVFDVHCTSSTAAGGGCNTADGSAAITAEKPLKEIQAEIAAIIRQITSCVTFLPLLAEPCAFDLLVYTASQVAVPAAWEESEPRYITNANEVRLRSFTTKIHKVDTMVAYKTD
eukprot:TRINITY_DN22566_c0_g1_i1.p1 TRINITY_DN22566_c0_g1~~TRINITY_DN22566_c0_g1_i1.p1  ORF type:complete len:214 (+),score=54.05 TRINITY_DN22566_c0_g1_i1:127-768(+)